MDDLDYLRFEAMLFFKDLDFSLYDEITIQPLLEKYRLDQGQSPKNMFHHPLMIYAGYSQIYELSKKYKAGDKLALIDAITLAAHYEILMPDWLTKSTVVDVRKVNHYELKTWNDIFGDTVPKGKSINKLRIDRELPFSVGADIEEAINNGLSINDDLFNNLAEKYNTNRDKITKAYKRYKTFIGRNSGNLKK